MGKRDGGLRNANRIRGLRRREQPSSHERDHSNAGPGHCQQHKQHDDVSDFARQRHGPYCAPAVLGEVCSNGAADASSWHRPPHFSKQQARRSPLSG